MGKSPGKWIKTILFGKKSSNPKSSLSKIREPSCYVNREEVVPTSGLIYDTTLVSQPVPGLCATNHVDSNLEKGETAKLNDKAILQSANHDGDSKTATVSGSPKDPERTMLEQAITKAQAVFRGYLARRAFRALKGIIRLQALIRGHLVRRQAVSTLFCTIGIIKLQAVVRGQKVRCSDFGIEVHELRNSEKHLDATCPHSFRMSASSQSQNLSTNAFIRKLLAPSPTAVPLCLQYAQREPNSAFDWLERWTMSHFWKHLTQSETIFDLKSQNKPGCFRAVDNEEGQSKWRVQEPTLKVKNGSGPSTLESEKSISKLRKASSQPAVSVQEHPQNEIEKVKRSLRKISNSSMKASDQVEADAEKPKRMVKKASTSASADVSEQVLTDCADKKDRVAAVVPLQADAKTCFKLAATDELVDGLQDHSAVDLQTKETNGKIEDVLTLDKEPNSRDDLISNEVQKTRRKASLITKQDYFETGSHNSRRTPSYMAATESAKAKLRGQGSPRLVSDETQKNGLTRRYSLPATIHAKSNSLSPRVQKVVQPNGKGGLKSEKSLSSSREGGDKAMQPEWRR